MEKEIINYVKNNKYTSLSNIHYYFYFKLNDKRYTGQAVADIVTNLVKNKILFSVNGITNLDKLYINNIYGNYYVNRKQ